MGRTKNTARQPAELVKLDPANTAALEAAQDTHTLALHQADARVRAVALQLGYQLPADATDPDLIQRDISANMRRSVEACLEVGRGLRVLKECCEHGQFTARLDVLGIDKHVAARFMQAASKFSKLPSTATLMPAIGNQTKLFEMLVLDDEQIEELELTGQTGELALDDIAAMSVKELRAALRQERHSTQFEAGKRQKAEERLDALEKKFSGPGIAIADPDESLAKLRRELDDVARDTLGRVEGQLRAGLRTLADWHGEHGGASADLMAGHLAQMQRVLLTLRDEFNLPDVVGEGKPAWQQWAQEQEAPTLPAARGSLPPEGPRPPWGGPAAGGLRSRPNKS